MLLKKIKENKETIGFGVTLSTLLLLLRFLEFKLLIINHQFEIYIGIIAILFTFLGIWIAQKITTQETKTIVVEKEIYISKQLFSINQQEIDKRKISKRELEVLELIAQGFSNQEIANRLFVSINTIKTHSSNLFEKLDVKRRTQAIEIAKKLYLIN